MARTKKAFEVNFDGLVGPTHNYAGLSVGNRASVSHKNTVSNPKEAALQGLAKMKWLADAGFRQAVLPPQERPLIAALRVLGFSGNDKRVLETAATTSPNLLASVYSASAMWSANAATVTPSSDSADGKVHFTAANLVNKFHRSLEPRFTELMLRKIFRNEKYFVHHSPLLAHPSFGDEGAANHTRLSDEYGKPGVHFYVFGKYAFAQGIEPTVFPARQTYEASSAIARQHGLAQSQVVFAQQHPEAIDAGAFHNDVVAVGDRDFFFYHERAYVDSERVMGQLQKAFQDQTGKSLQCLKVKASEVDLESAVSSYLFNTQLLSREDGTRLLVAPQECLEVPAVKKYLERMVGGGSPISEVRYFDLRQSMQNGGGPACLRLRVVLTEEELRKSHRAVFLDDKLYETLVKWVSKHYRDRIEPADLADPALLKESRSALDELTRLLKLGSLYPFQR